MDIEFKRVDPVKVTETDKNKRESVPWVKEAIADTTAATKDELKKLTYEVNPFIKKVEGKEYWEYDIGKVKGYLDKLKDIKNFKDIANIDWKKKTGAYTVKWIMAVQIALKALWVAPDLTIDWVLATQKNFSRSATVQAISDFQKKNNIRDKNGVPYGATIQKLLEKLGGAVSGTASESTGNRQDTTGQIIQQPWNEKTPSQKKITNEQFISEVITPFEEGSAFKSEQISAIENKLKNYLKNEDISKYQQFGSEKGANWKGYLSMDKGLEFWIGTFKDGKLVDGIKVLANGNVEEVKNIIAASEVLSASQMFEESPIGKTFKELSKPATWLSSEVVQAWKKQAEDYFKDKNPQEYESDLANWKWIYYDPDQKDIQIGIFKNKFLQEGIVLQKDKVLFITWQRKTSEKALFEKQPPQKLTEWQQKEVPGKTDAELTQEVIDFFSQADFDTLAHWNGSDFEKLGEILSKLSLDGLAGKTEALRVLKTSLNNIVTILKQNKKFPFFDGAQRKKALLKQITGIIDKVWGISAWELKDYQGSQDNGVETPDNGVNTVNNGVKTLDNKDKLLNKENILFSDVMSGAENGENGKNGKNGKYGEYGSAIYKENEANLKHDEEGNYYFLIGKEKYYKPHEDDKGNLIAQIPHAKYYEKTKYWELTVISFGELINWFISEPDFELRSDDMIKESNEREWKSNKRESK